MTRPLILVAEDDFPIRRGVVDALTFAGFQVLETDSGEEALALVDEHRVDLVLLDVMLPGREGFEVLSEVRTSYPTLPVIMVTARGAENDRVRGLQNGADDYVIKPFSARELIARVEAVLRRSPERSAGFRWIESGTRRIDLARQEVLCEDSSRVPLTERETSILRHLTTHRERAIDRKELLYRVWGMDPRGIETRTVDMHIARLRDKVEVDPANPRIVCTVRGKGYMLGSSVKVDTP